MLLELALWLGKDARFFNVFGYITLRTVLAAGTALAISLVCGPLVIRWLAAKKIGQAVRDDGPKSHLTKAGTPTMGGALILIAIGVTTLLWGDLRNKYVWVTSVVTLGFGAVGWVDDWRKVVHRDPKGLASRWKYLWTSAIALAAAISSELTATHPAQTELIVPFFKAVSYPLGVIGFVILTYFVINGTSHSVNLTDGLDGLAIMPTVMVSAALAIFAYVAGHVGFSKYLGVPYIPGAGELAVFCGAICRRGAGFPVVQRLSGGSLHGRRRRAGARGGAGHDRGDRAPGDRALHHGRPLRRRSPVGDGAGAVLQIHRRQAHLPHGAAASPL
jgi:phospho-N-acetylmuramoyl-pentapeptide-transferase